MARAKEKTIWQVLSAKNPESITLEEVKNAMRGVNPNNTSYSGKGTPLCYAVRTGRMDIIRYFVEELETNLAIPKDHTPLQIVLENGNMELVKYFLELDPLVGGREYQADCICAAISSKQFDMLKFLVEEKKFFVGDKKNDKPLCSAVQQGAQFFKYLIKHGAIPTDKVLENTIVFTRPLSPILKYLLEQTKVKYNLYKAVNDAIYWRKGLECVKYLFSKGASVKTEEDKYGHRTPLLFLAVQRNNIEIVKYLINQGADIREKDYRNETILECTGWGDGNLPLLKYIVEDLNYFDGLEKDCSQCMFVTVAPLKYFVEHGFVYKINPSNYNNLGLLAKNGNFPLLKYVAEELGCFADSANDVLLAIEYVHSSNYKNFLYLIEKGASVNARNYCGKSVLDLALNHCYDHPDIPMENRKNLIKLLLQKGARCRNFGTPKAMAFLNECMAELQKELPSDKRPEITFDMLEKAMNSLDEMKSLLNQGFQVPQEIEGISTLGFITQKYKDNILKYFVEEKNFDVNYRDSEGRTPLMHLLVHAICWGMSIKCFSYLLEQKADVNCEDQNGISILQYACLCSGNKIEVIKALIRHGAEYQALLDKGNRFIAQALKEIEQEKSASEK